MRPMDQVLPELFDAPDDAEVRARLREWMRAEPVGILRCATEVAQGGRAPSTSVTMAAREEIALLDHSSPVALREEMERMLVARNVHVALQWLHDVGAM